ncbi:MAG: Bax inhibitor-1/YccA family protein [Chloroflexi bacterium]|nr:Bax inhibitor-1/YccA family protein [Chloroflexota bacterium]
MKVRNGWQKLLDENKKITFNQGENKMAQAQAVQTGTVSEPRVLRFMAQIYLLMSVGLLITALVSTWVSTNPRLLLRLNTSPGLAFGLFIIQIVIVIALSAKIMDMNTGAAALLFFFYAALTGLTISFIFLIYTSEQISSVFWITAGTFFITSLVGFILKIDLAKTGGILFMLLCGWSLAWLFSIIFSPASNFNWTLNFIGIALFVGLTAWDTAALKKMGQQLDTHPARGGLIVLGALKLYLDFINLFLLLLRASSRR